MGNRLVEVRMLVGDKMLLASFNQVLERETKVRISSLASRDENNTALLRVAFASCDL